MLYAAYGSNLHPLRLERRHISARLIGTGRLDGHGLRFHKRGRDASGKCNILDPGDEVYLAIYEMTVADKRRLDGIEGVGGGYTSESLRVAGFGECFTYVAEQTHIDNALAPFDWYREMVIAGCRYHDFPSDYVERIRAVDTIEDGDTERNGENWETVEILRR